MIVRALVAVVLAVTLAVAATARAASQPGPSGLSGTSWRLVQFQGGDDKVLTPDDRAKYTLEFGNDGRLAVRLDCNRGSGMWTSAQPGQLQFSPMALTRAMCPPGSLHDRMARDWTFVRTYVLKGGHLHLSLTADGGIYEFEPAGGAGSPPSSPVPFKGPVIYQCQVAAGGVATLRATFYQTVPAMVLLERDAQTRPAFNVVAASGTKYDGPDVVFWEARGQVTVTWSGTSLTCTVR